MAKRTRKEPARTSPLSEQSSWEQTVAWQMVQVPEHCPTIIAALHPEWMIDPAMRAIVEVGHEFSRRGIPFDAVDEWLKAVKAHPEWADLDFLQQIGAWVKLHRTVAIQTIEWYCAKIATAYRLRKIKDLGHALQHLEPTETMPAELAEIRDNLAVMAGDVQTGAPPVRVADALDWIDQRNRGLITGSDPVTTGLTELDEILAGGLHPGQMVVLGGGTGKGKSALALQMAGAQSRAGGRPVYLTIEMSGHEQFARALASGSGVRLRDITGTSLMDSESRRAVAEAATGLERLVVIDTPPFALRDVERHARAHRATCLFVDYLQLMELPAADSRREGIDELCRGLKRLAGSLKIPIVLPSQLSREKDEDRPPVLADLRESGEIENSANVVLFVHRDRNKRIQHDAQLIVAKNRNGAVGSLQVTWEGARFRFYVPQKEPPKSSDLGF